MVTGGELNFIFGGPRRVIILDSRRRLHQAIVGHRGELILVVAAFAGFATRTRVSHQDTKCARAAEPAATAMHRPRQVRNSSKVIALVILAIDGEREDGQLAVEHVKVLVRRAAVDAPLELPDLFLVLPELRHEQRGLQKLQIRLAVKVGRGDVGCALRLRGADEHHICGDLLVIVDADDVARSDLFRSDRDRSVRANEVVLLAIGAVIRDMPHEVLEQLLDKRRPQHKEQRDH